MAGGDPDRRRGADPDRRRRQGPPWRRHARDAVDPAGAGLQRSGSPTTTSTWASLTKFTSLAIAGLPKTAEVTVVCKGGGCKGKSKTLKHSGGKLNVLKALKSLKLKSGAKLTITVRGEGNAQAIARYVIRQGKRPTDTYRCVKAGDKLAAC